MKYCFILAPVVVVLHMTRIFGLNVIPLRRKFQKITRRETSSQVITISLKHSNLNETAVIDDHLMELAIEQAKLAGLQGEVPIGALIAYRIPSSIQDSSTKTTSIKILSYGRNEIETLQDASAHAEMQALRSASYSLKNWRLLNCTLYTTVEPCPMCLSAAQAFRVSRIVYGAPDLRLGATGTYVNLLQYQHPFHNSIEIIRDVRGDEAKELLVNFFRRRRKNRDEISVSATLSLKTSILSRITKVKHSLWRILSK